MNHIVLLGDSVFDNAAYVRGGPDVITHLRDQIPKDWEATLLAVDGGVSRSLNSQLLKLPSGATHLVVSVGGNDALHRADLLEAKARSAAEVLSMLADAGQEFQRAYRRALDEILDLKLPTAVCTIYYPRFADPTLQRLAVTGLAVYNDVIVREAILSGIPLIDLRLICNRDDDYANPIEPSVEGGRKIAGAIVRLVNEHDFGIKRTEVFV